MPVPKRKTSKSRKNKRQTHWKTSAPAVTTCPECGGKLRVIASIQDPPLIAKILGHVQQRAALIARLARGPPAESISLPHLT